jgi:hypothetical protein
MRLSGALSCLVAMLLVIATPVASAQEDSEPLPPRNFDYRIEIGQHEQLVKIRKSASARLSVFVSDGCSGGLSVGWEDLRLDGISSNRSLSWR